MALGVGVLLLVLLQTRFFALFFVLYIGAALLLNIAWQGGWTRIAPPKVYEE
jgi:CDP-diacylglycerol--serine O-phosphatidyltransferase